MISYSKDNQPVINRWSFKRLNALLRALDRPISSLINTIVLSRRSIKQLSG